MHAEEGVPSPPLEFLLPSSVGEAFRDVAEMMFRPPPSLQLVTSVKWKGTKEEREGREICKVLRDNGYYPLLKKHLKITMNTEKETHMLAGQLGSRKLELLTGYWIYA